MQTELIQTELIQIELIETELVAKLIAELKARVKVQQFKALEVLLIAVRC